MLGQPARTISRALAAVALSGAAVLAVAAPGLAATDGPAAATQATAAAAKAKGWWASGYTGKQVHATLGRPGRRVHRLDGGAEHEHLQGQRLPFLPEQLDRREHRRCLELGVAHNGAKLVIINSVKLSNGKWRDVGPALTISKAVSWPGHPAFGGQYHALVYTPGNVHVVLAHIESWISNGGVPYPDPTGSGDSVTLSQFRRC